MGKYNGAVITAAGQNLIAQAIAESKTVTFTTAQASSHVYPSSTDFEALTALTDVEKTVDINYAGVYSDTVVQVSARFDNDGVDTAYLINTLGFFAQLGTDTPILFAVSTAVTPDQMPVFDADNPSAFIYNMQMTVQNADSINVSVNPAGTVTVEQLNTAVSALQTQINAKVNLSGIIDNLNETSAISGDVLSAHQGNVIAKMIAPIEANPTSASQGYAKGEQFILNGLLSEATTAIAQNAAFVLDGNYKLADSVTKQINKKSDALVTRLINRNITIPQGSVYQQELVYASEYMINETKVLLIGDTYTDAVFDNVNVSALIFDPNVNTILITVWTPGLVATSAPITVGVNVPVLCV